ncbi:MAG TPA: AmmeMemoRadiSam system protein B, partial [Chroococcales cyanobacterium]
MFNFGARANSTIPERRSPSFAGTWYEGVGTKLKSQLDEMLNRASNKLDKQTVEPSFEPNPAPQKNLLGIIVPHAGYMFSGATAAYAYKFASRSRIKRVFLL